MIKTMTDKKVNNFKKGQVIKYERHSDFKPTDGIFIKHTNPMEFVLYDENGNILHYNKKEYIDWYNNYLENILSKELEESISEMNRKKKSTKSKSKRKCRCKS